MIATLLTTGSASAVQQPTPTQTLCILDFHRVGDDARADWLEQGLADMMINTMHSMSPYLVIERKHLQAILREHGLTQSGLVDTHTAVRQAHLAKAQLLLQGSFALQGNDLTVQVRLIRVSDQRVLAEATWTDHHREVLSAASALSEQLQANLGQPLDPEKLRGIEHQMPRTIDVARSYYQGVRAFDEGRYPEALAHYIDSAAHADDFRKAHLGVLEMYYLLGRSEHAVLVARRLARAHEDRGDVAGALEYYFAAARECLDPLHDPRSASELLRQLLRLVEQHERKTGEIATTKRAVLTRVDELLGTAGYKDFGSVLTHRDIRHQMWIGDVAMELDRRAEEQARGGYAVLQDGKWVKQSVPPPSMLMWKTRALRTLAQAYALSGETRHALDRYQELLEEHSFLSERHVNDPRLVDSIKTEAHFMWLRHYTTTGSLIRDHAMNRINKLNLVSGQMVFAREFRDPAPDVRARVASRGEGQGHEYFDFVAPGGLQIDSLTLRATVEGIAEFGFSVPKPTGWPPQYSLSKRFEHFKFSSRGVYERRIVPPPGTQFLSVGTSWGPGLYSNTLAEVTGWLLSGLKNGPDLVKWELSFAVSPKNVVKPDTPSLARTPPDLAVQTLMARYAAGWTHGHIVRDADTQAYTGTPRLDVHAEEWLVYSMNGDIRIFHQQDRRLAIRLPTTINSREREFDASLVRTDDGRYALLWTRGTSTTHANRFVAYSADFLRWDTPQRLVFDDPPGDIGYTHAHVEPLERSYNVVAIRGAYTMLLAQGFVRRSDNLRDWGPPRKVFAQDLGRNRLLKSRDGTVWAVYENSSSERQPYTQNDWLHGSFGIDGKQYRHVTELRASRSVDGIEWQEAGKLVIPGQPSAFWAFTVDERQIGIAASFNNLFVKWFTASPLRNLMQVDAQLQLFNQSEAAEFFVRDGSLTCVRPLFDFEGQKPMLLATSTAHFLGGSGKK